MAQSVGVKQGGNNRCTIGKQVLIEFVEKKEDVLIGETFRVFV